MSPFEPIPEKTEAIARVTIGAAIEVHRQLGPGLLEGVYRTCLAYELEKRGLKVRQEVDLPIRYDGKLLDAGFRLDLVVEELLVVELKAVERLLPVHEAQLMTYLKLSGYRLGFLMNFYVPVLKDGIKRMVN